MSSTGGTRNRATAKHRRPVMVGVGASAGGLDALSRFFKTVKKGGNTTFVVAQHLDPTRPSHLVEIIDKVTPLDVVEATDAQPIVADHVYIVPPDATVTVADGHLHVVRPCDKREARAPIDALFLSLAEAFGERAICVLLSGTGTDGLRGMRAIKDCDGVAMVQEPETALAPELPSEAVGMGLADVVSTPSELPRELAEYAAGMRAEPGGTSRKAESDAILRILSLLRTYAHHDFSCYKRKMVTRRITRRMLLCRFNDLTNYYTHLCETPSEVTRLAKDLLINVTRFFRDAEVFRLIRQKVAPVLLARRQEGPVRVWVPACATGEEAYSLAMTLCEQAAPSPSPQLIQIFATDVDEQSLARAREGVYTDAELEGVSAARRRRFFTPVGAHTYQIDKRLREMVTFARHNVIGDPPFSRLDLITCRNLLIYLNPEVQARLMPLFHFALNDDGYLVLGASENTSHRSDLFAPVSKKWCIFRRLHSERREDVSLPLLLRSSATVPISGQPMIRTHPRPRDFGMFAQRLLLQQYAPAAVLVDARHEILYLHGPTSDYLELPTGEPTRDLLAMAREGLRAKLREVVDAALSTRQPVAVSGIPVRRGQTYRPTTVRADCIHQTTEPAGMVLLTFQDDPDDDRHQPPRLAPEDVSTIRQLENELKATRDDLQSTIEQSESSNEELRAANEEVMSINEELQSANEELETSKEELQSLNEELGTVNAQLQEKVVEVEAVNADLANLLRSVDIATVFLDNERRIKRATPAMQRLVSLIPSDRGRPIDDIALNAVGHGLQDDIRQVQETLQPIQREVHADDSAWYVRRVTPYRTQANTVEGVVVSFLDITEAEHLRCLATVLSDSNDAVTVLDANGRITAWNRAASEMYGYTEDEALGMEAATLFARGERARAKTVTDRVRKGNGSRVFETRRNTKDGRTIEVSMTVTALRCRRGELVGMVTTERDITEEKRMQAELANLTDNEQRRMGRELHDTIGQQIAAMAMLTSSLQNRLRAGDVELAAKTAERLMAGFRDARTQVRAMAKGLLPLEMERAGLCNGLQELTASFAAMSTVACVFNCKSSIPIDDREVETHLYRIAQEALRNAVEHSRCTGVTLTVEHANDRLIMTVRDNGKGMDDKASAQGGFGLRIMRHRASLIGATLRVRSTPGGGTTLTCTWKGRKRAKRRKS